MHDISFEPEKKSGTVRNMPESFQNRYANDCTFETMDKLYR